MTSWSHIKVEYTRYACPECSFNIHIGNGSSLKYTSVKRCLRSVFEISITYIHDPWSQLHDRMWYSYGPQRKMSSIRERRDNKEV
jgi:hypothetical protein